MSVPVITIITNPKKRPSEASFAYRVAGCLLISDRSFPVLEIFRSDPVQQAGVDSSLYSSDLITSDAAPLFNDLAWLGNADRRLECRPLADGYWLSVDQLGMFTVRFNEGASVICFYSSGKNDQLLEEMILGAPLILALAQQNIFCLHASAALVNDRAYAFVGDSGKGKSTLAAYLGGNGHSRIGDDILPILIDNEQVYIHSHFPQLKIPVEQQPAALLPEKIPLSSVFVLDESESIAIEYMDRKTAFLSLIHQTVAVRLFASELTASHMAFCQHISAAHLVYPRELDRLDEVKLLLESFEP